MVHAFRVETSKAPLEIVTSLRWTRNTPMEGNPQILELSKAQAIALRRPDTRLVALPAMHDL